MKKIILVIIGSILLLSGACFGTWYWGHHSGHNEGYDKGYRKGYTIGYTIGYEESSQEAAKRLAEIKPTPQTKDIEFTLTYTKKNEQGAIIQQANIENKSSFVITDVYVQSEWYNIDGTLIASKKTPLYSLPPGGKASALIFPPSSISNKEIPQHQLNFTWIE